MRWERDRILAYLRANTQAAEKVFPAEGRPRLRDLIRLHWMRGGWWDHLLMTWLVPVTFGLSAWLWRRRFASCCFAGYLAGGEGKAGCLIHPRRVGEPDLRRHAFPLVPTLGCNRRLRCPMLDEEGTDPQLDLVAASRHGAASLRVCNR